MPEKTPETGDQPQEMTFGEKVKLLSEEEKSYVMGYIDRAALAAAREKRKSSTAGRADAESGLADAGDGGDGGDE